jgi:metallo-beta-lactamase family protein
MRVSFYGGAREVTGSCYLVETAKTKFLVDCGLFQSGVFSDKRNYDDFGFNPSEINFVLITHAHTDHTGRLPKLCKENFKGKIYATAGTLDLARIVLEDSVHLMIEEAERKGKRPPYEPADVECIFGHFETKEYHHKFKPADDIEVNFLDAGHILGSTIIEIWAEGKKLVFTGDLGNPPTPLLRPTELVKDVNYLFIESTYGDRLHEDRVQRKDILEDAIEETIQKGGVVMIPSFAIERTQELLFEFNELVEHGRIPKTPLFLDSPMAIKATKVYQKHESYFNKEAKYIIQSGDDLFKFPGFRLTLTSKESKAINEVPPPKIIIAGSGSSMGGRILHHELRYLSDPSSTIIFVGYQVAGSLGRRIFEGAEEVKIFNELVPVRAKVVAIGGYSAHADQNALINFVRNSRDSLKKVFVLQGEEEAAMDLAQNIGDHLAIDTEVPYFGESVELK